MLTKTTHALALAVVCCSFAHADVIARYTVELETLWNRATHPNNYPSSAHFSPLIGAAHNDEISFWSEGASATLGIENVAEIGSTTAFQGELDSARRGGVAGDIVSIPRNLFSGQLGVSDEFAVTEEFPLLTLATMVAPSSDWFIGVHDLDLRDGPGFVKELVFEFDHFYDAGTEDGNTFSLSNPPTDPRGVISRVDGRSAAFPFHGLGAATLEPIARLTITRTSITGLPGDYDGDGEVDSADYDIWREQFGATGGDLTADGNGDGVVDAADFTVWRDAVGDAASAVPEPATLLLLASLGSIAATARRR